MVVQLQRASYKGFPFLVRSVRTQGGQKTASHEFPGSDKRSVQDLGQRPDVFTVDAIVHGDDYIADVSRLKQILSEGGFGDFVHPSQGTFSVKATGFLLVESDAEKGIARFEINFSTASPDVQPVARQSNVGAISRQTETVKSALKDRITTDYNVNASLFGNFTDAINQVTQIADAFDGNARLFAFGLSDLETLGVPGLATFVRSIKDFREAATSLAQTPSKMANDLFNLFDTLDGVQVTSGNSFRELIGFFDFGDDDTPNKNDTFGLIERTTSRDIIRSSVQAGALAEAFREASLIEFQSIPEIETVADNLETQHRHIKDDIDDDSRVQMAVLRDMVRKLFDDQRVIAAQIIQLDLPVLPAIVQAQALYGAGAQDRVDQLISINNVKDTGFVGGRDTSVLTA